MKTTMAKSSTLENKWHLVDAQNIVLGRLAAKVSRVLMGKHKPSYTPHLDDGDFVVIVNCDKIRVTGRKREQKFYNHYTGYLSGLRERSFEEVVENDPTEVVLLAIKRMMPKTKLGRAMLKKLKLHAGPDHPHSAQNPQALDLSKI